MSAVPIIQMMNEPYKEKQSFSKAVRAVIIKNQTTVLMHLVPSDTYVLPGGSVDDGETLEEALHREVLEETGYTIRHYHKTLIIQECFDKLAREHHIYLVECDNSQKTPNLTEEEQALGMTMVVLPIEKALQILAYHKGTFKYSDEIQRRECIALLHSIK